MLQIEQIFTNVPKGQVAKRDDWSKAFKEEDMGKVIEEVSRSQPARGQLPYLNTAAHARSSAKASCK